ncbi:MAG TPA: hypothetical protein VGX00_08470 [Thermoplasmata archaeon]|nr:hypothetical protein [Thermoplasmata archaeon]
MEATRAVRIPVARRERPTPPGPEAPGPIDPTAVAPGARRENRSGTQRAVRTFVTFLVGLLAIYGLFLGSFLTAPEIGVRSNPVEYLAFTAVLGALVLFGFAVTVGRAPRDLRATATELWVRERSGRLHRFPSDAALSLVVLKRYPSGLLSSEGTEIVRVSHPEASPRTYLVETGFFPPVPGR